ncbi:hypothetical protein HETIRDRAFT_168976 [Heterobasidion irregulare TC 32-1]|uniref:Uncharacterized protein n=1 Tax=Heterobasidion irregulare (strain TC 32-1) TaxID=747525 RepID=W4K8H9_HETIT|nr:uncharacterized protein HETIRDRAFT_168976 [Heterobasidion irregulare TC 32-1]ETW82059.1 hypothetical protein HETIRDRAFT_168976 [Heterobasidion irregulare TC 32-1]
MVFIYYSAYYSQPYNLFQMSSFITTIDISSSISQGFRIDILNHVLFLLISFT